MEIFVSHCNKYNLDCSKNLSVLPPDSTTLFTTSGMQKHKQKFPDPNIKRQTLSDIQHCLRLNDLNEIGDGTHYLDFHMLGLFSFRHWTLNMGVNFWLTFLQDMNVLPDTVTIHPNCQHHRFVYKDINVKIIEDPNNIWSDGNIGGYCTEFFKEGVEIGNIVVPLGENLDCGFGLERIGNFIPNYHEEEPNKKNILNHTINILLNEGITPTGNKQGFILKKLIRIGLKENILTVDNDFIQKEIILRNEMIEKIPILLKKYPNKDNLFFKETFGINLEDFI